MAKSDHRVPPARVNAEPATIPPPGDLLPRRNSPAGPDDGARPLLARILDTPHLAQVIPRLQPELVYRMIQRCGLEDCGDLIALVTPAQLTSVLDLDLWRHHRPGAEEQFDADRFGVWLEVLVDAGAAFAAQKVAELDVDMMIAAFGQHVRVFDSAAAAPYTTTDGDECETGLVPEDVPACEVGGYTLVPRRAASWDAVVAVLVALDAEHGAYFHRLMAGCRGQSNSRPEVDGLDDLLTEPEQVLFDLASSRERRRAEQGYVTPLQARAFLQSARQIALGPDSTSPDSPIAVAYLREIRELAGNEPAASAESGQTPASDATKAEDETAAVAAMVDLLAEAGVLPQKPRALLAGQGDERSTLTRIQAQLQFVSERDAAAYARRSEELGYLANVIVAGCSIQGRSFTPQEASDAAAAICNLGLENWPRHWASASGERSSASGDRATLAEDFLIAQDLIAVFQVGWSVLYQKVCLYSAEQLVSVLRGLRHDDREVQAGLTTLRIEMARQWREGTPWRARDALDVVTMLDMPTWAALLGLTGECPVIHAGLKASRQRGTRAVSASAFEFISENSQIASIHEYLRSLVDRLNG
jgi:hypothetical protein